MCFKRNKIKFCQYFLKYNIIVPVNGISKYTDHNVPFQRGSMTMVQTKSNHAKIAYVFARTSLCLNNYRGRWRAKM